MYPQNELALYFVLGFIAGVLLTALLVARGDIAFEWRTWRQSMRWMLSPTLYGNKLRKIVHSPQYVDDHTPEGAQAAREAFVDLEPIDQNRRIAAFIARLMREVSRLSKLPWADIRCDLQIPSDLSDEGLEHATHDSAKAIGVYAALLERIATINGYLTLIRELQSLRDSAWTEYIRAERDTSTESGMTGRQLRLEIRRREEQCRRLPALRTNATDQVDPFDLRHVLNLLNDENYSLEDMLLQLRDRFEEKFPGQYFQTQETSSVVDFRARMDEIAKLVDGHLQPSPEELPADLSVEEVAQKRAEALVRDTFIHCGTWEEASRMLDNLKAQSSEDVAEMIDIQKQRIKEKQKEELL